ncbi:MAG: orotate phosphoribosyltransferase [Cellulosilyticum sp.]|nr:orotate phosphoribosyltransferase [Cellulosilyticum sp.]
MEQYKKEFIEFMVRSGVLTFGDFTTKSGRKTPYFVNTGNYKTGAQAAKLGEFYAKAIKEHIKEDIDVLFGPAYKGIPLAVATSMALATQHDTDVNYCFNRKEEKDHGEGGKMVGYKLQDGDNVLITEDVITSGASIRECLPQIMAAAKVNVIGEIISVDRMERGLENKTAIQQIYDDYGFKVYPIVNVKEVIEVLHNNPVDGKVYIDDEMKAKMEAYLEEYCVK